jgi:ABC-type proline/glycine betaine transport system permease subunit
MTEDRISMEKYVDKQIEALEKNFRTKTDDMEKATKVAKEAADAAMGKISMTNMVAIVAVLLSLITFLFEILKK